jgi:hypothetical protein
MVCFASIGVSGAWGAYLHELTQKSNFIAFDKQRTVLAQEFDKRGSLVFVLLIFFSSPNTFHSMPTDAMFNVFRSNAGSEGGPRSGRSSLFQGNDGGSHRPSMFSNAGSFESVEMQRLAMFGSFNSMRSPLSNQFFSTFESC